jgi:cell division protein FtsA
LQLQNFCSSLIDAKNKRYTDHMREQIQHFVGLDIGTATVRCVVGSLDLESVDPTPSIIGYGTAENLGMRKGVPVHIDDVAHAISEAVTEAERLSGVRISRATVNINGSHVSGGNSKGVIAISNPNREISEDDRLRVEEAATIIQLPPNREIVQVFAKNYRLDGQDNIKDPVGMKGVRLEVDTHIVTAATHSIKNTELALEKAAIVAQHRTVSSLAAAEAVLDRKQKESGTVIADIGAGTTNVVVLEEGEVQHVAVIPMGGINITNDLAIGLKTDLEVAEHVKLEHGTLLGSKIGRVKVVYNGSEQSFDRADIDMIIRARVEEILEFIDKELKKIQRSRKLPGGIVFVGGSSKLPGLTESAKEKLQLPARIGSLEAMKGLADGVADPAFATPVGLMLLDMLLGQHMGPVESHGGSLSGLFNNLFKRNKR